MDNSHYSSQRKIDPSNRVSTQKLKPDFTPDDNNRVEIGPTQLAFTEWQKAGLEIPNLPTMRKQRLTRLSKYIKQRELAGILLFDPLNIRYASDSTNMQLWNTHNLYRACFVSADGYMIVWDFKNNLLTAFNPLIRETRSGASFFYFASGDFKKKDAKRFVSEIESIVREHSETNKRLAVDKIMPDGYKALEKIGFELQDGEELMEKVRSIKQSEEIKAMRCSLYATEQAMHEMKKNLQSGITENDIWAILHSENIKRGGEWIEARLMASGPRTNPWFQECGPRIMQEGELLAFDTDLVGCYGMCSDISRTWLIGDNEPTQQQKELYTEAYLHITENCKMLKAGVSMKELSFGGRPLPKIYQENRYCVKMHGVGLCDEWPSILYPQDYREGAFEYPLESGMVICVEAYIGCEGGTEGVKLEDQVLITDNGYENLTHFPFENKMIDLNLVQ
jgi:Xaa-Pro aminopeptidase